MRLIIHVETPRGWKWSGPFDNHEASNKEADKLRALYPYRKVVIKDTPLITG